VCFANFDAQTKLFFAEDMGELNLVDTCEDGNVDTAYNEKGDYLQEKTKRRGLADNSSALTSCMRQLTRA
jgi:hypothetical protein